jgi:hypothetical protein
MDCLAASPQGSSEKYPAARLIIYSPSSLAGFPISSSTGPSAANMEIIRLLLRKSYQSTEHVKSIGLSGSGFRILLADCKRRSLDNEASFTIEVLELKFWEVLLIKSMTPTALRPRLSMHQLPTQDTYFYHHHTNPRRTP